MASSTRVTLQPPTWQYVQALKAELAAAYDTQDKQIEDMRAVRELTAPVAIADDYRLVAVEVRDPTATDEAQRVAATLSINPPKLTVLRRKGSGESAEENATLRETWTMEVLRQAGTRTPGQDTFTQIVDGCVGDGGGWCKLLFGRDLWDERYAIRKRQFEQTDEETGDKTTDFAAYNQKTEDAKKRAGSPFIWKACDARTIYPVWAGGRLAEVLEVQERPLLSTFRRYRLKRDAAGDIVPDEMGEGVPTDTATTTQKVEWIEHWDETYVSYFVGGKNRAGQVTGQRVDQWKHGYGACPYFFAPGILMGHWRNRKVGWSVGESKKWLVKFRGYLLTLAAQLAARDVLAPLVRTPPADGQVVTGRDRRPIDKQKWELGTIINLRPGETLGKIEFPDAPYLDKLIGVVDTAIERLTSPRVRSEVGAGLEGAGWAINQILSEARIIHDPLAQALERMLVELTRFLWRLVRTKVKEQVWVYSEGSKTGWLGAGPDDLPDTVNIQWRLDPERPSAKLIEQRYWAEAVKAGFAGMREAVDAQGRNFDEVRQDKLEDLVRVDPRYINYQLTKTFQRMGYGFLLIKEQADALEQTGMWGGVTTGAAGESGIPPAMGSSFVPDMGNLAMAPGGAGAEPVGGFGPGTGSVAGVGAPPIQSQVEGAQQLLG